MKHILKKFTYFFLLVLLTAWGNSCKDTLDVELADVITPENSYKTVTDANNAVLGVYSQIFSIAKQYIILNELRGDLLDITENSDADLRDVNNHNVKAGNKYADPAPFYNVINTCNDVLSNLENMKNKLRLTESEFNERYSDIKAIRCWIYFQMSLHFGSVPYITTPFESKDDIKTFASFPKVEFNAMLDTLINTMESLPTLEKYFSMTDVSLGNINFANYSWFDKKFFLADLYTWSKQYHKAVELYRIILDEGNTDLHTRQVCSLATYSTSTSYRDLLVGSSAKIINNEYVWLLYFDKKYSAQNNPFVDLFSVNHGQYLIKPSETSMINWREQYTNYEEDRRGLNFAWKYSSGKPEVYKHTLEYNESLPLEKPGKWWIYRMESIHLRFAENANRDNHSYLGWVLVNGGMLSYNAQLSDSNYSYMPYIRTNEPFPYDFSGVSTSGLTTKDGYSIPTGNMLFNVGLRGRARLGYIDVSAPTAADSVLLVEDMILNESARELAYEGHRWPDLVRIAMRRNDPSILANRIYEKFRKANHPDAEAIRNKLMDPKSWFLPFPED